MFPSRAGEDANGFVMPGEPCVKPQTGGYCSSPKPAMLEEE